MTQNGRLTLVQDRAPAFPAPDLPASTLGHGAEQLLVELQARGMRFKDPRGPGLSRRAGAGPSDHKAVRALGHTLMVPIFTEAAEQSPFEARVEPDGTAHLYKDGQPVLSLAFPQTPRFYALSTADGVPYHKLATLHADDVLATTVLQNCTRYGRQETACKFCGIGRSLNAKSTIAQKSPAQLAEVAEAAVRLDGVKHMVLTTGTPPGPDRGARLLSECAAAIRGRVDLPLQAQCEPPEDFAWFERLHTSGVVTLGMHLEAVTESVRRRVLPGKAEVPIGRYLNAFESAVAVFGRGQVTTYILAGLGDSADAIVDMSRICAELGVYPFVVPFVPIAGTPLGSAPPPEPRFVEPLLQRVAQAIADAGLASAVIKAGCGRCGACSTLKLREARPTSLDESRQHA